MQDSLANERIDLSPHWSQYHFPRKNPLRWSLLSYLYVQLFPFATFTDWLLLFYIFLVFFFRIDITSLEFTTKNLKVERLTSNCMFSFSFIVVSRVKKNREPFSLLEMTESSPRIWCIIFWHILRPSPWLYWFIASWFLCPTDGSKSVF